MPTDLLKALRKINETNREGGAIVPKPLARMISGSYPKIKKSMSPSARYQLVAVAVIY